MTTKTIDQILHDKHLRDDLFREMDGNGNGGLSLAEIDGYVKDKYPGEFEAHALMRAYKAADVSQDGFIERAEFFKCALHACVALQPAAMLSVKPGVAARASACSLARAAPLAGCSSTLCTSRTCGRSSSLSTKTRMGG